MARNESPRLQMVSSSDGIESSSELDAKERATLLRGYRFLSHVQLQRFRSVAADHGYTAKEHEEGWRLLIAASRQDERDQSPGEEAETEARALLETWLPRLRALAVRLFPRDRRSEIEASFFAGLCVETPSSALILLDRIDAFAGDPGLESFLEKLEERGLGVTERARLRESLSGDQLEPSGVAGLQAESRRAQRQAAFAFEAWFTDWTTTLRSVFTNQKSRKLLSLTVLGARKKPARRVRALPRQPLVLLARG